MIRFEEIAETVQLHHPGADLDVLRLDYDLPANPRLFVTVRRVLDELVQVADGYYLGKAYVRWYWGAWSMVAYFALRPAL